MLVRAGILSIPQQEPLAIDVIVDLLSATLPQLHLLQNTTALSQRNWLEALLCQWCDEEELDLIITIGGTAPAPGPSTAEIVPDATSAICERLLPGLAEGMRAYAAQESTLAWLERCAAGIRGRTLIVNLPAGAAPALLFLEAIVHLIEPVLAYLHDTQPRLRLVDMLDLAPTEDSGKATQMVPSHKSSQKDLSAEEFAEFLRRSS